MDSQCFFKEIRKLRRNKWKLMAIMTASLVTIFFVFQPIVRDMFIGDASPFVQTGALIVTVPDLIQNRVPITKEFRFRNAINIIDTGKRELSIAYVYIDTEGHLIPTLMFENDYSQIKSGKITTANLVFKIDLANNHARRERISSEMRIALAYFPPGHEERILDIWLSAGGWLDQETQQELMLLLPPAETMRFFVIIIIVFLITCVPLIYSLLNYKIINLDRIRDRIIFNNHVDGMSGIMPGKTSIIEKIYESVTFLVCMLLIIFSAAFVFTQIEIFVALTWLFIVLPVIISMIILMCHRVNYISLDNNNIVFQKRNRESIEIPISEIAICYKKTWIMVYRIKFFGASYTRFLVIVLKNGRKLTSKIYYDDYQELKKYF
jgi:hypothetical protein